MTRAAGSRALRVADAPGRHRRSVAEIAFTEAQVLALPAAFDLKTAGRAFGLGESACYELVKRKQFPVPVLTLGRRYRCLKADVVKALGLSTTP